MIIDFFHFVSSINDRLIGADHITIGCRSYPNAPEDKILPITVYLSEGEKDLDEVLFLNSLNYFILL